MTYESIVEFIKEFGIFIAAVVPLYGAWVTKKKIDNEKQKMNQDLKLRMQEISNQTEKDLLAHFEKIDRARNEDHNKLRSEMFDIIKSQNQTINELNATITTIKKDLEICHAERQKLIDSITN